jgi:hypothetical protein
MNKMKDSRQRLLKHKIYSSVDNLPKLQVFMKNHVFAVWDFMTLLKRIQNDLTCTSIPWTPSVNTKVTRFFNEIVLEEECDEVTKGNFTSHFELYMAAMKEIGSDPSAIMHLND